MGITQTKRQQALDNTIAVGGQITFVLNTASDPCNIHGLMLDINIGSNVGSEHNFGAWALVLSPRGTTGIPAITTGAINFEADNPIFWMLGSWMNIDRGFTHIGGAPRTSRNCPRGGRLQVTIANSPVSTSAVRVHGTATWFETIK